MPRRLVTRLPPTSPEWVVVAVWQATGVSRLLATYAIVQGGQVVYFGDSRWASSPALANALTMPGGTLTWGLWLTIAGVLGLWGSWTRHMRATAIGQYLGGVWSAFFTVSQLWVCVRNDRAATTGIFVYAFEAVLFLTVAFGAWRLR